MRLYRTFDLRQPAGVASRYICGENGRIMAESSRTGQKLRCCDATLLLFVSKQAFNDAD
jgi:hypothetical protein